MEAFDKMMKCSLGGWRRGQEKCRPNKKANRRVKKRKGVGRGDVRSGIRSGSWVEQNMRTEFDRVVSLAGEAMPEKAPMTGRIRKRSIVGVAAKEVTAVTTVRGAMSRSKARLRQVGLDEVPTRVKSACRTVGDEEEPVGRKSDRSVERSPISRDRKDRRFGRRRADRNGSSRRDQSNGKREH